MYQTNKERLSKFFYNNVYYDIGAFGIDYNKTIAMLSIELNISKKIVKDFLDSLVESGKLEELRVLVLNKDELEKRKKEKDIINKEVKEVLDP